LADELCTVKIFCVERKRGDYFDSPEPAFGLIVDQKFPSAGVEIDDAAKCLALGRSTACVMHLMRVLEIGLGSLAKALGIPFGSDNWNKVLGQCEEKIGKLPKVDDWKGDEQFYSEAASHFRLLKNAWRNHAMHARIRYDDAQAETIFLNVRAVMKHLATRLSEATGTWS
jgi:hypothetical protein